MLYGETMIRGRSMWLPFLVLVGCNQAATPQKVCQHIFSLSDRGDDAAPSLMQACVDRTAEVRKDMSEEAWSSFAQCVLQAKTQDAGYSCMPERADEGGSHRETPESKPASR